jgi:hypothetical protein
VILVSLDRPNDRPDAVKARQDRLVALAGSGVECEALWGTNPEREGALIRLLVGGEAATEPVGGEVVARDAEGKETGSAKYLRLDVGGVRVTIQRRTDHKDGENAEVARQEFLRLFDAMIAKARPDVVLIGGEGQETRDVLARARAAGITTVILVDGLEHRDAGFFADADAAIVPSRFAAHYYREAIGLRATVLPPPLDRGGMWGRAGKRGQAPRKNSEPVPFSNPVPVSYVTFIDPTPENGVYPFARIAEELGKRRPEIPVLVVEGKGNEETLSGCGIDLRGVVNLMSPTFDSRRYWDVTRICVLPTLGVHAHSRVAAEALSNGIPVIASERGALPETLGAAGIVLTLPDRLTPATKMPPTAAEVAPWVETIIRLWDDAEFAEEHRRKALLEAERFDVGELGARYVDFLTGLAADRSPRPKERPLTPRSQSTQRLAAAFPWPEVKPNAAGPNTKPGWLDE